MNEEKDYVHRDDSR